MPKQYDYCPNKARSKELNIKIGKPLAQMQNNDHRFLRSKITSPRSAASRLSIVDLFCGIGGLSLGVHEAAKQKGFAPFTALAVDNDQETLKCYLNNFADTVMHASDVCKIFRKTIDAPLSHDERQLQSRITKNGFLIGGPPCQGHSDLNNATRRNDPKNSLYFLMARAAKVLEPFAVMIENVPTVIHDKNGVVAMTRKELEAIGYKVYEHVFDLHKMGVPQTRKRHVLVACKASIENQFLALQESETHPRNLDWAIGDLTDLITRDSIDHAIAKSNETTQRRIDYLFDNGIYDLPDSERPPCHRNKKHSYNSIYGRLQWSEPAQTVTRGFYSMCMGRYVHPSERRTLSAREAARIQFLPDWFSFAGIRSRTKLATAIGNAVPPKLSFLLSLALLDSLEQH